MAFPLTELFPDRDYRFHLTLRKGDLGAFFGAPDPGMLAERGRWIASDPARYLTGGDDALPLVAETESLLGLGAASGGVTGRLARLGGAVEPDVVLLARDGAGRFRLRAGVVCFPSWWAVTEKTGLTIDEIHGVVPGLNDALAPAIGQFLARLKPGAPYERVNWGLAATPELNLHPALGRPRLGPVLDVARTWLRVEEQILAALPVSGGVLFGIRIRVVPLTQLLDDAALRTGLRRALVTMSDALAVYKGLEAVRAALIRECER